MKKYLSCLILIPFLQPNTSWGVEVDCESSKDIKLESLADDAYSITTFTPHVSACFADNKLSSRPLKFSLTSYSLELKSFPSLSNLSFLKNDFQKQKDICDCVNEVESKSKLRLPFLENSYNDVSESEEYALIHLEKVMDTFQKRSDYNYNMMLLHAQSMGGLANFYQVNSPLNNNPEYAQTVSDVIKTNVRVGVNAKSSEEELNKKFDDIILSAGTRREGRNKSVAVAQALSDDHRKALPGQSCVPMKSYLLLNSFPESNKFWNELKDDYNRNDWDIAGLIQDYKSTSNPDERASLSSKIEFLEKNPFVKFALNSGNDEVAKKVYGVISKYMKRSIPNDCGQEGKRSCRDEFQSMVSVYNESLAEIFKDKEVAKVIQQARAENLKQMLNALTASSRRDLNIDNLNEWARTEYGVDIPFCKKQFFPDSAFKDYLGGYQTSLPLTVRYTPESEGELDRTCTESIPKYCQAVGSGAGSLLNQGSYSDQASSRKTLDDFFKNIDYDMNPDPESNREYQFFAKRHCEYQYRIHNGKSYNFLEYEKAVCSSAFSIFKTRNCNNKELLYREFILGEEDIQRNEEFGTVGSSLQDYYTNMPDITSMSEEEVLRYGSTESTIFFKDKSLDKLPEVAPKLNDSELSITDYLISMDDTTQVEDVKSETNYLPPSLNNNEFQDSFNYAYTNALEAKEEIDQEIKVTKEKIAANKERLVRENTTLEFKSEVETRLELLESLLKEKEKTSQDYQNIITQLLDKKTKDEAAVNERSLAQSSKAPVIEGEQKSLSPIVANNRVPLPAQKMNDASEESFRAPASVENFSTTGGSVGGSSAFVGGGTALSSGAMKKSGAINTALLSKYGITVQETDSAIQVAQDKERSQISQLLSNASKTDIGLEVSRVEYDQFKKYDIEALNKLYEEKIELIDSDVVKLMIHTEGEDDSLEFYAIKENGKIVFQPVRKSKLTDLKNALK